MSRRSLVGVVVLGLCLLLPACASRTIIESVPNGAEVYIDGERVGRTPLVAHLSGANWYGSGTELELRLDGYRTVYGKLDWQYDPSHWGWLLGIFFPPSQLIHLHPRSHRKPLDRYTVVLEEDMGNSPDNRHVIYGYLDDSTDDLPVERQREVRGALPRRMGRR